MNDFRPIALTSCVMKVSYKSLLVHLNEIVSDFVDPCQFAYKSTDLPGASIRLMFFDFSSAFNTIQPHLLCDKLLNMNICPSLITWIIDYLSLRP